MKCPACKADKFGVIDSRCISGYMQIRIRKCSECGNIKQTTESVTEDEFYFKTEVVLKNKFHLKAEEGLDENCKHYVYCLIDPRDDEIFYIGKGAYGRLFDHEKNVMRGYNGENPKTEGMINEIHDSGFRVQHCILKKFEYESDAITYEERLIKQTSKKSKKITNIQFN